MKKKILLKGYTITVTSWENDGDNNRTESMTVESKDEAQAIVKMCKKLFVSSNNGEGGIGNLMEDDTEIAAQIILDYIQANPEILQGKKLSDEKIIDLVMDYNYNLMGGSEYYYSRVFESCDVVYSDSDIFTEAINL